MIQTISSFREVNWENLPSKSLVIFDIDEILITPADLLLKPVGRDFNGWGKIPLKEFEYYLSIMLASTKYVLVDAEAPNLIKKMLQKGILAIALTACSTGAIGVIQSMEEWRFNQLNALGIDFSPFFEGEYVFSELVDAKSRPPLFKNGILFTGDLQNPEKSAKGQLLGIFLDKINWSPEKVIFIDDSQKHLEAVFQELNQRGIPFQGHLLTTPTLQLNEKIAELQIRTLLDTNKWITDQEAKILD